MIVEQLWAQEDAYSPRRPNEAHTIQNKSVDPHLYNMTTMQDIQIYDKGRIVVGLNKERTGLMINGNLTFNYNN